MEATFSKLMLSTSAKRSTLKGKHLLPMEKGCVQESNQKVTEVVSLANNGVKYTKLSGPLAGKVDKLFK